ncbi:hypothetical protein L2E82_50113 [Cichorium intybus]|nr:hypothetical protein L2E82_50113 [Cichorium intybus]
MGVSVKVEKLNEVSNSILMAENWLRAHNKNLAEKIYRSEFAFIIRHRLAPKCSPTSLINKKRLIAPRSPAERETAKTRTNVAGATEVILDADDDGQKNVLDIEYECQKKRGGCVKKKTLLDVEDDSQKKRGGCVKKKTVLDVEDDGQKKRGGCVKKKTNLIRASFFFSF